MEKGPIKCCKEKHKIIGQYVITNMGTLLFVKALMKCANILIFLYHKEIYSPVGMYDGIFILQRDIYAIPSRCRNPVIVDIFNRLCYMECR